MDRMLIPHRRSTHAQLEGSALVYGYGDQEVLSGVDVSVFKGEVLALLGPNGTGKSTLLKLLLGLAAPQAGTVKLDDKPLERWSRRYIASRLAYVPQNHVCPFPYTVRQVVEMGTYHREGIFSRPQHNAQLQVDEQLQRLHISHLAERRYTEISGGERQLTLVCRALVQGANILMLDEPASALDFGHQAKLLTQLRQLADDGFSVVMTTHHPHHARMIAHRVMLLKQGKVMAEGTLDATLNAGNIQTLYGLSEQELLMFSRSMTGVL